MGRLLNQLQAGLHGVLQEAIAVIGWYFLHTRQQVCLLTLLALLFVVVFFSYCPVGSHSCYRVVFPAHTSTGVFVDIVGFVVCWLGFFG